MSIYIKSLKTGKLQSTAAAILPGSLTKATIIKSIILTNNNSTTETVNITIKTWTAIASPVQSAYQLSPLNMKIPPGGQVILDAEITIANNFNTLAAAQPDEIWGGATTANQVDFVFNGLERDL